MSKIDEKLFNHNAHALEREYDVCPKCGSELVFKSSKHGAFLGCASYPQCDYMRPLHEHVDTIVKELDVACPQCGTALAVKNGRYGMFIGCTAYPACDFIVHEQAETEPAEAVPCPECKKGHLVERKSRYGKAFWGCDQYPKCQFGVNYPPIACRCQVCHYPLVVKRSGAKGEYWQCANKKCAKKMPPLQDS